MRAEWRNRCRTRRFAMSRRFRWHCHWRKSKAWGRESCSKSQIRKPRLTTTGLIPDQKCTVVESHSCRRSTRYCSKKQAWTRGRRQHFLNLEQSDCCCSGCNDPCCRGLRDRWSLVCLLPPADVCVAPWSDQAKARRRQNRGPYRCHPGVVGRQE